MGATAVLQGCYRSVTRVLYGFDKAGTEVLQGGYRGVM